MANFGTPQLKPNTDAGSTADGSDTTSAANIGSEAAAFIKAYGKLSGVRHTSKNSDSMSSMDLLRTFDAAVLICIAVCNGNRAGSTHAELLQVAFDHRSSCLCLFDTNNKLQLPPACPYRRGNNCLRQCACCFLCLRQSH